MRRIVATALLAVLWVGYAALAQNGNGEVPTDGGDTVFTIENIVTGLLTITLPWFMGKFRKALGLQDMSDGAGFLLAIVFSLIVAIIGKALYIIVNQEVFSLSFLATKQFYYEGAAIVTISQLVFQSLKQRKPEAFGKA